MKIRTILSLFLGIFFLALASMSSANSKFLTGGFDSHLVPPFGKIKFLLGQQSDQISNFKQAIGAVPDYPYPSGYMLYNVLMTDGFWERVEFEDLITDFRQSKLDYPIGSLNVGLILMDSTYGIPCGKSVVLNHIIAATGGEVVNPEVIDPTFLAFVDESLTYVINQYKKILTPVYLRPGYEFDNTGYCFDSESFKRAFRGIKQRVDELGAKNIAMVWHAVSGAYNDPSGNIDYQYLSPDHYDRWYPGDDVVDWVGFSSFFNGNYEVHQAPQWCQDLAQGFLTPEVPHRTVHDRILDFARVHNKPVIIAESAPTTYDLKNNTASCILFENPIPVTPEEIWETWFEEYFDYIEANRDVIRIVSLISSPWQDAEFFRCAPGSFASQPDCPIGYWGRNVIQDNPYIFDQLKLELQSPYYLNPRWVYEWLGW